MRSDFERAQQNRFMLHGQTIEQAEGLMKSGDLARLQEMAEALTAKDMSPSYFPQLYEIGAALLDSGLSTNNNAATQLGIDVIQSAFCSMYTYKQFAGPVHRQFYNRTLEYTERVAREQPDFSHALIRRMYDQTLVAQYDVSKRLYTIIEDAEICPFQQRATMTVSFASASAILANLELYVAFLKNQEPEKCESAKSFYREIFRSMSSVRPGTVFSLLGKGRRTEMLSFDDGLELFEKALQHTLVRIEQSSGRLRFYNPDSSEFSGPNTSPVPLMHYYYQSLNNMERGEDAKRLGDLFEERRPDFAPLGVH